MSKYLFVAHSKDKTFEKVIENSIQKQLRPG